MVRTALCLDQADTLFGPCGDQPCCSVNSFINSTARQFLNIETCNTQACPGKSLCIIIIIIIIIIIFIGGPASVLGFIPHSSTLSHENDSSVVIVTVSGTTQANISIVTTVTSPIPATLTFTTTMTQSGGQVHLSFAVSQSVFTPTFSVTNRQIVINGRSLFLAAPFSTVRTIAPAGSIGFMRKSAIYTLGRTGIASFIGVSPYYYVSPMGHLYEYPDTKPVKDKAPGKFFRRRALGSEFIITSENPFITASLSRFSGSAFTIVPVANGAAISFNFRNFASITSFKVSSSTSLNKTVAPTSYFRSTLTVGSQTYPNIDTVTLAGEGFESYEGGTTAFSTYDAYYLNGRRAVFSTSARLSSMIQEGQMFLAGGGNATAGFSVDGNKVLYAGITVFNITPSISITNIKGPAIVRYEGQTLSATGGLTINDVKFFSFNPPPVNDGFAINGGAAVSLAPNTAARVYRSGTEVLLTTSNTLKAAITAAQRPIIIPRNTANYATILRQGTGILQLNGNDVVAITGSVWIFHNNIIMFSFSSGKSQFLYGPNNRGHYEFGHINDITSFTYAPAGQDIQRYVNSISNIDVVYFIADDSGRVLLTDDAHVIALVTNPQFSVTFGSRDSQGRFPFMLGGSTIQTFDRTTQVYQVPISGRLRLVNTALSGFDQNAVKLFQKTVSSITTYFVNERVPGPLVSPASITATSPLFIYITGGNAFVTDRSSLQIAINNALVEPSLSPMPSTTLPSTVPPSSSKLPSIVPPLSTKSPSTVPPSSSKPPSIVPPLPSKLPSIVPRPSSSKPPSIVPPLPSKLPSIVPRPSSSKLPSIAPPSSTKPPSTVPSLSTILPSIAPPSCSCPSIVPVCKLSILTTSTTSPSAVIPTTSPTVPIISSTVTVDRKIIEGHGKFQVALNIEIK